MTPLKSITKRVGNTEWRIEIDYDHFATNPREDYENGTLCIREHRDYSFDNELEFDFNGYDDGEVELPEIEGLTLFWLDCHIHSGISFSIAGQGMQCRFDTASKCGFILAENEEDAEAQIKEYNSYANGECYTVTIESREIITRGDKEFFSEWEIVDAMNFIGWENIIAPSQSPLTEEEWEKFINS